MGGARGVYGVVDGRLGISADVDDLVTGLAQHRADGLLQAVAGMVGSDRHLHAGDDSSGRGASIAPGYAQFPGFAGPGRGRLAARILAAVGLMDSEEGSGR